MKNISFIVPVYNEEKDIKLVLNEIKEIANEIIIINDGSKDDSLRKILSFKNVHKKYNIKIINHENNKGYIQSIYEGGLKANNNILLTMDSDNQHYLSDVKEMINLYNNQKQIILGVRKKLPRLGEKIIAKIIGIKDATTGLKLFNKIFLEYLKEDNYYGAKAILQAKHDNYQITEYPIQIKDRIQGKSSFNNLSVFIKAIKFWFYSLYYKMII